MTNEKTLLEAIETYGNWCAMRREALNEWVAYDGNDFDKNQRLKAIFDLTTKTSAEHFEKIAVRLNAIEGV